ncbi:AAA family ATPase [Roseobacteraceae bacterium S113]
MSIDKLEAWLENLGLGAYTDAFKENEIDWDILPELTKDDLQDIGVTMVGHRRKLLKAIEALDEAPAEATAPAPEAETPVAQPTEQHAERRQVSVLFCDMVGSTSLSAQIDPEDMRDVQRMYQDAVAAAVTAHGGHVANFIGDGIVVYFGWPIASENQAVQAARAGRAALEKVSHLTVPNSTVKLEARAGIATGQVVVGDLSGESSHQSAAISGEAPNRAARLQELAAPGQLAIDTLTKRLLRSTFELVDHGTHALKGLDDEVQAFLVENEASLDSHFDGGDKANHSATLVGRKGDDELIKDRWDQAVGGEGQAVLLTGEAGIGKSRMIRQLYNRIEDEPKTILRYQCAQNLANAALHPIVNTLEKLAQFDRDDAPEVKLDKLELVLQDATRPIEQTRAIVAALLKLPADERYGPLGMSPQRLLEETLATIIEQIMAVAQDTPLLIVFEDLHWADPTSIDLIGRLIAELGTRRVMLLATFREEFSAPWPSYPHLTQLSLNRIGQAACSDLIDQLTGGKPLNADIKAQIIEKADGVPLFVEEITKTVLEAGYVVETETGFEPAGDDVDLGIPATIQDALTARLDRFSPVKNVAQIGACIGRDFSYDVIQSIAGMSEPALPSALEQLVQAEIVFSRGTPPLSTYLFKHALLRDAAYDSLLRKRKRHYHSQIVQYLETQEPVDAIRAAMHSAAAGEASKAVTYFLQAGRASMGAGTFGEAISQLRMGLVEIENVEKGPDRDRLELDLRVALGTAEMAVNGWAADKIVEVLDPAVPLAKSLGDNFALGLSLFSIWIYHATRADMETSQTWLAEMDAVVASNQSLELQLISDTAASMNYFWVGAFDKAEERRVRTLRDYKFDQHGHLVHYMNHDPYATVLQWGGATQLWCQGHPEQSLAAVDQAIAHARTLESPFAVIFALTLGALSLIEGGHGERMLRQCEEASKIADEIGLPFIKIVSCDSLRGRALVALGRDEEGVPLLTQATAMWEAVGGRTTLGEYTTRLALGLGRLGRFDEAFAHSEKALAHEEATGEIWYQPETHRVHGQLLLTAPEPKVEEGLDYLRKACALAQEQGALSFELRAATTLAQHLHAAGETAQAKAVLEPVYARFEEGFGTPDLIAAKALLAQL